MLLLLTAAALSLDALGIGAAYGACRVKLPVISVCVIGLVNLAATFAAICAGRILLCVLSRRMVFLLGILSLILAVVAVFGKKISRRKNVLSVAVSIIRYPCFGRGNCHNAITPLDAVLVGIALSFDSVGAGLAVCAAGAPALWLPVLSAALQAAFIMAGRLVGVRAHRRLVINVNTLFYALGAAFVLFSLVIMSFLS